MDKIKKPYGYSWFPQELGFAPRAWAEATGKVPFYKSHDKVTLLSRSFCPENLLTMFLFQGGHFAALELPDVLWQDIVEFVDHVQATRK